MQLKTSAMNLLARVKEKLQGNKVLSPEEQSIFQWMMRMKRREARQSAYAQRNAAYPYQSKRQLARNLIKIKKGCYDAADPLPFRVAA